MSSFVNLLEIIYPVGSFYLSANKESPANIVGGTWVQIEDAALRGSSSVGYVGSDTHTLTINEMPSHSHGLEHYMLWDVGRWQTFSDNMAHPAHSDAYSCWGVANNWLISSAGGGAAHSILQRSFNCYIWRRVS